MKHLYLILILALSIFAATGLDVWSKPAYKQGTGLGCYDCHDAKQGFFKPTDKDCYLKAKDMAKKYPDQSCVSCHKGKAKP